MSVDPVANVTAGDSVVFSTCTTAANNGTFVVKQVDRSATANLVIYNTAGVGQGGAAGTCASALKLIAFAADQSATFATNSRAAIIGVVDQTYNAEFNVTQVNRGGGSNFNIAISNAAGTTQASPAGTVELESRSIFSTRPTITATGRILTASNGVLDVTEKVLSAGLILSPEVLQIQAGAPINLMISVA